MLNLGVDINNSISGSTYGFNPITRMRILLEWIHRGSWLGGVAIDLLSDDMTRAGVELKGKIPPKDIEKIEEMVTTYGCWEVINDTVRWSRLYGGAIAVFLIDGQKLNTPFRLESVGKGQFKGLVVLDRWMIEPSLNELVTEPGPAMGMPKYYRVVSDAPALLGEKVHYTRCLRLEGIRLPYYQRLMENLWGISVFERLYDRLVAFDAATQGASQLIHKSFLRTLKLEDLRVALAAGGKAEQGVIKQVHMMRKMQQNEGISVIDAKDEFQLDQSSGYAGIADMMLRFGEQLSGALQIPLVRLFGQSPAGLSSSGESDLRTYYDGIKQQQNRHLKIPVTRMYRCAAQSLGIQLPEGFAVEFRALWQMSEKDRADTAAVIAQAVDTVVASNLLPKPAAMKELRQSSETTGVFSNITDEAIAQAEADATLEEPPSLEELEGAAAASGSGRRAAEAVQKAEGVKPDDKTTPTAPATSKKSSQTPGKELSGGKTDKTTPVPLKPKAKKELVPNEDEEKDLNDLYGIYANPGGGFVIRAKNGKGEQLGPFKDLSIAVAKRSALKKEQAQVSKASVDYSPGKPVSHCGSTGKFGEQGACANFVEPDGCRRVLGSIDPDHWCKLWAKAKTTDSARAYRFGDLDVIIETAKGEIRSPYGSVMPADYGYIRGSSSAEGPSEQMDCFVGPNQDSKQVWVVHQRDLKTNAFDEHKVLLGFRNAAAATDCYVTSFNDGRGQDRIIRIDQMPLDEFKDWLTKNYPYGAHEASA